MALVALHLLPLIEPKEFPQKMSMLQVIAAKDLSFDVMLKHNRCHRVDVLEVHRGMQNIAIQHIEMFRLQKVTDLASEGGMIILRYPKRRGRKEVGGQSRE